VTAAALLLVSLAYVVARVGDAVMAHLRRADSWMPKA
jgi:hypothetical protein